MCAAPRADLARIAPVGKSLTVWACRRHLAGLLIVGDGESEMRVSVVISGPRILHVHPPAPGRTEGYVEGTDCVLVLHIVAAIVIHDAVLCDLERQVFKQCRRERVVDVKISAAI